MRLARTIQACFPVVAAIVALGTQIIGPTEMVLGGTLDGNAFAIVAWNAGARSSWFVRCAD